MMHKIDEKNIQILKIIQDNCKISTKEIAKKIESPITTVYAKIKKMESLGIIKHYKAVLDAKKLDKGTTAFIFISFAYRESGSEQTISQREIAEKIAKFPDVSEVYIITGDWDILVKVKSKDVDEIGKFVVDKLRKLEGIAKALSCIVYSTTKESLDVNL